jgi:hypothetical protein
MITPATPPARPTQREARAQKQDAPFWICPARFAQVFGNLQSLFDAWAFFSNLVQVIILGPMATSFLLNTGATIPSVGLGTWHAEPGIVGDAVYAAVKVVSPQL